MACILTEGARRSPLKVMSLADRFGPGDLCALALRFEGNKMVKRN